MGKRKNSDEEPHVPQTIDTSSVVAHWCELFEPCASEEQADAIYTIGRLRDEFGAWMMFGSQADDPLIPYLQQLELNGFRVIHTFGAGPAILCKYKEKNEQ